jgi:hypothetical protein
MSYRVDGDEHPVDHVGFTGFRLQLPVGPVAQEAAVGLAVIAVATSRSNSKKTSAS